MVNVGCRDVDGLEKCGHELKVVFRSVEKLLIAGNLVPWHVSVGCGRDDRNEPSVTKELTVPAQLQLPL